MRNEQPTKIEIGDDSLTVTKKATVPLETAGIKGYDKAYETIDGFILAKKNGQWYQLDPEGIDIPPIKIGKEEIKKWLRTIAIPSNEWKPEYAELPVKGIGKLIDNKKELLRQEIHKALTKLYNEKEAEEKMQEVEIKATGSNYLRAKIEGEGTTPITIQGLLEHFPVHTHETENYNRKIEIVRIENDILFWIKETD